jgi:4-amino-4-deoxy-L-arabinose transferase-like glycosyltransferase
MNAETSPLQLQADAIPLAERYGDLRGTFWLAAILFAALVLRLYRIDQPLVDAFSWRQSSTAMIAENYFLSSWNIFFPEVNWTGPGPNYQGREFQTITYLSALLWALLGQQDWIGRLVAALFSVWGVYALYRLVALVWDIERARVAAAVLAVLPGSVFVGRSFLPDPVMVSLVTTSLWLFVLWLRTGRTAVLLLLATAAGALGFLTKITGLIVGLPMLYAIVALIGVRSALRRRWLVGLSAYGVLTLGSVAAYYLWARHLALTYPPHHFAGAGNWVWDAGVGDWIRQGYFLPKLTDHVRVWLWTMPFAVLIGIGLVLPPRRIVHDRAGTPEAGGRDAAPWFFHWWFAAGVVFYLFAARELVDNPWNLHIISPAVAALAASAVVRGLDIVGWRGRFRLRSLVAMAALVGACLYAPYALRWMYHPYAGESYRLGGAVARVTPPQALVVSFAGDLGDPTLLYYSRRRGWVFPPARPNSAWGKLPDDDAESVRLLGELQAEGAAWVAIVESQWARLQQERPRFHEHLVGVCVEVQMLDAGRLCRLAAGPEHASVPGSPPAIRAAASVTIGVDGE